MNIKAIKTDKITPLDKSIFAVLDKHLNAFEEGQILAITSKIISICQGRVVPIDKVSKDELVFREADYFLPKEENKYGVYLTIKNNIIIATAGIDESNGGGYYVLWPENAQEIANKIREYLTKKFNVKNVGVIITDSKTTPLRWGTTGAALVHSGFNALKDYIGTPDIFGKDFRMTKANISDALATASVLVMGEGNEQTPIAVIDDVLFVEFQDRNPTPEELSQITISIDDDLYAPLLKNVGWKKGRKV